MNKEEKKELKSEVKCKQCEQYEKKLNELALTIDKVEDEKLEIENQLKKALADYHNLVNNSEKRNEIRFFQIKKNLAEAVIPSLDSLRLAIISSKDLNADEKTLSWIEGVKATLSTMERAFDAIGLKQYVPNKGDKFEPSVHEAVATVPEGNSGEIYDLVTPGYILDNTVIRPARVVVSK